MKKERYEIFPGEISKTKKTEIFNKNSLIRFTDNQSAKKKYQCTWQITRETIQNETDHKKKIPWKKISRPKCFKMSI